MERRPQCCCAAASSTHLSLGSGQRAPSSHCALVERILPWQCGASPSEMFAYMSPVVLPHLLSCFVTLTALHPAGHHWP